nr:MAG TPA: hypothetical protein [Caudoviricetes sp.]
MLRLYPYFPFFQDHCERFCPKKFFYVLLSYRIFRRFANGKSEHMFAYILKKKL